MVALLFDTHKAVKDLQEAGFDEPQAEALVSTVGTAIVGNVATKQDVLDTRNDLRSGMQAMELRITLRMGGLIVAGVGLIIALAARPRNGWLVKMEPEAVGDHRFSPLRAVASPLPEHGPSCWE